MAINEEVKEIERKLKEKAEKAEKELEQEAKHHPIMFFWDPAIFYLVAIIIISNLHSTPTPEKIILGFSVSDKIKHVILYIGFSMLLGMACRHSRFRILNQNHYFIALTASSIIGILDEVNQIRVPGRHMLLDEILLNIAGSIIGQASRTALRMERTILRKIF